ncbi:hypothetical protein DHW03_16745 [Pedobacter yonginense]|uniref:Uncharacterized protein n=1 Tax=Pedobacter yonginense TaxID=651869 RepID=A0A317EN06_9SPHI|nr:hypothetical protein [Pedobacter yonginense]PWS26428.1 hypothetical protein DHW03_16745 [Pedobacter yonginense]
MKIFVILLIFSLFNFVFMDKANSQECLITQAGPAYNRVYTSPNVNVLAGGYAMYNATPSMYSECGWTPVGITGKACGVCSFLGVCVGGTCACLGTIYTGYEASSFTIIDCPIDNYTWAFALSSAVMGVFMVRKRIV